MAAGACAVSAPATAARCEVVSGEKLLVSAGGAPALCAAVDRAIAARGLVQRFTVRVRVEPRSIFAADITLADGRRLPTVNMAEMDRPLTSATLDYLGKTIVDHVANAR